jgi:hypothetical protein
MKPISIGILFILATFSIIHAASVTGQVELYRIEANTDGGTDVKMNVRVNGTDYSFHPYFYSTQERRAILTALLSTLVTAGTEIIVDMDSYSRITTFVVKNVGDLQLFRIHATPDYSFSARIDGEDKEFLPGFDVPENQKLAIAAIAAAIASGKRVVVDITATEKIRNIVVAQ